MIKLCHLITRADSVGGAQIHVLELARSFKQVGVDVTVLSGPRGSFTEKLDGAGISSVELPHLVRAIGPVTDWKAYLEIRAALQALSPDIVMLHSSKAAWLGRLACRRLGIPSVFTAHGWAFTEGVNPALRAAYRFAEWLARDWADRTITVSEYDRQLALRSGIGTGESLVTIHNGVRDTVVRRADPSRQPVRIAVVARMDVPKEHALLLHALARVARSDWILELLGDGPNRPALESLVKQLSLERRVVFMGSRNDVAELLGRAQLFVLASRWEGLPRSILEAMRAGLPVIASDVGGVPECVEHDVTGLRVARGSVEEMVQALELLLGDPAKRVSMGHAGRTAYERAFTLDQVLSKTWPVLAAVLAARGREALPAELPRAQTP